MAKPDNSKRDEEIIRLHTVEKLSYGQIAYQMQINRNVVAGALNRAGIRGVRPNGGHKDISNRRFGRLVAMFPTAERYHRYVVWNCQCDCGVACDVSYGSLASGNTRSCGCLAVENGHRVAAIGRDALRRQREVAA